MCLLGCAELGDGVLVPAGEEHALCSSKAEGNQIVSILQLWSGGRDIWTVGASSRWCGPAALAGGEDGVMALSEPVVWPDADAKVVM